ncbi:hypothetical protein E3E36_01565 [Thermococcus sp. M36]|uniref:hypothetical protein n=1 Tax=Thermococcus sp. M36 TaxID=1638261 RepID=UPI00143B0E87|nr:hypothetical protein [Thermococcus sp. M36]NJE04859.1 hypothetical protein [Thermococcus sp. M36]
MRVKLGYPDRIVEIDGDTVRVFKGRLVSAPLSEVVSYYLKGEGLLSPLIKDVAGDVVRVLLSGSGLSTGTHAPVRYGLTA